MLYAVIAAGGTGNRMNAEKPKQYLCIGNKPIIAHTVKRFYDCRKFKTIIVLCPEEWYEYTTDLMSDYYPSDEVIVIKGGGDRNETIKVFRVNAILIGGYLTRSARRRVNIEIGF